MFCISGYGFVDFDSPAAAQKAVSALKASGVQAQMAKVSREPVITSLVLGFGPEARHVAFPITIHTPSSIPVSHGYFWTLVPCLHILRSSSNAV